MYFPQSHLNKLEATPKSKILLQNEAPPPYEQRSLSPVNEYANKGVQRSNGAKDTFLDVASSIEQLIQWQGIS